MMTPRPRCCQSVNKRTLQSPTIYSRPPCQRLVHALSNPQITVRYIFNVRRDLSPIPIFSHRLKSKSWPIGECSARPRQYLQRQTCRIRQISRLAKNFFRQRRTRRPSASSKRCSNRSSLCLSKMTTLDALRLALPLESTVDISRNMHILNDALRSDGHFWCRSRRRVAELEKRWQFLLGSSVFENQVEYDRGLLRLVSRVVLTPPPADRVLRWIPEHD